MLGDSWRRLRIGVDGVPVIYSPAGRFFVVLFFFLSSDFQTVQTGRSPRLILAASDVQGPKTSFLGSAGSFTRAESARSGYDARPAGCGRADVRAE